MNKNDLRLAHALGITDSDGVPNVVLDGVMRDIELEPYDELMAELEERYNDGSE